MRRWITGTAAVLAMALAVLASAGCGRRPANAVEVTLLALAGPVCPVETSPPDPACAARPVPGATLRVVDERGRTVTARTDQEGRASVDLTPGRYRVEALPVEGLMGTPPPADLLVGPSGASLTLAYDTGIR